jgi:hypothetical protein
LVNIASNALDMEPERLRSARRDAGTVRAREAIAVVAVERYAVRIKSLAQVFGKPPDTVIRCVGRGAMRRAEDEGFRVPVDTLDHAVREGVLPAARSSGKESS